MSEAGRDDTGFAEAADTEFAFLAADYGFYLKRRSRTEVVYQSSVVGVRAYQDWSSYELGLYISLLAAPETRASIQELRQYYVLTSEAPYFRSSEPSEVRDYLRHMGEFVRKHCGELLRGNVEAWDKLARWQRCRPLQSPAEQEVRRLKELGAAAWLEKDFRQVIVAYTAVEKHLSERERARLEYARRECPAEPE
jgi:hypothetical protein